MSTSCKFKPVVWAAAGKQNKKPPNRPLGRNFFSAIFTICNRKKLNRDFPFGFWPTNSESFLVFSMICLLHRFAIHFSSPASNYSRRGRCFDAILSSNALFLPDMKTPLPSLLLFSCESFHYSFRRIHLTAFLPFLIHYSAVPLRL